MQEDYGIPTYGRSKFGANRLIVHELSYDSNSVYHFVRKKTSKDTEYWYCLGCARQKGLIQNNKRVASVRLRNGRLIDNPEEPNMPHFCTPIPLAEAVASQLDRDMRVEIREQGKHPAAAFKDAKRRITELYPDGDFGDDVVKSIGPYKKRKSGYYKNWNSDVAVSMVPRDTADQRDQIPDSSNQNASPEPANQNAAVLTQFRDPANENHSTAHHDLDLANQAVGCDPELQHHTIHNPVQLQHPALQALLAGPDPEHDLAARRISTPSTYADASLFLIAPERDLSPSCKVEIEGDVTLEPKQESQEVSVMESLGSDSPAQAFQGITQPLSSPLTQTVGVPGTLGMPGGPNTPMTTRAINWSNEETDLLLSIVADERIRGALEPGSDRSTGIRHRHIYDMVATMMQSQGYDRTAENVKCRLQNLKASYKNALQGKKGSCRGFTLQRVWQRLEELWGPGPSSAMADSSSQEDYGSIAIEPSDDDRDQSMDRSIDQGEIDNSDLVENGFTMSAIETITVENPVEPDQSPSEFIGQPQTQPSPAPRMTSLSTDTPGARKRGMKVPTMFPSVADKVPKMTALSAGDGLARVATILEENHKELIQWEMEKERRRTELQEKWRSEDQEILERHRQEDKVHQLEIVKLLSEALKK